MTRRRRAPCPAAGLARAALLAPCLLLAGCYEIDVQLDAGGSGTARLAMDVPRGEMGRPFDATAVAELFEGPGVDVTSIQHLDVLDRRRILLSLSFRHVTDLAGVQGFKGLAVTFTPRKDTLELQATYTEPRPDALRSAAFTGRKIRVGVKMPGIVRASDGAFDPTERTAVWETGTDQLAAAPLRMAVTSGTELTPAGPLGLRLAMLAAGLLILGVVLAHGARDRLAPHAFLLAGGLSTLAFEVVLTRLFSAVFWYHFAFMAISIALLGQGAGASLVTALGPRSPGRREDAASGGLGRSLLLTGISIAIALAFIVWHTETAAGSTLGFALLFLLSSLPFLFFGAGVARVFEEAPAGAGPLYFANLLGAAAGTLLAIPLLTHLGAETALLAVALIAASAGAGLSRSVAKATALVVAVALAWAMSINRPDGPMLLRTGKGGAPKVIDLGLWNSFSYITVGRQFGAAWALPPGWRGNPTRSLGLEIDLNAFTPLILWNGDARTVQEPLDDVTALVHRVRTGGDVLVIGPGGGKDVLAALVCGARRITAVEINPLMANLVKQRFAHFSGGLYSHPSVELVIENGRSYVDSPGPPFDVIQASLVDTWAASASGAFTLTENHLYTREAFETYLSRLKPGGILSVSRWHHEPPRESLRLLALAAAALEARGAKDPMRHVAVVLAGNVASFLIGKDPLDDATRGRIADEARRLGFELQMGGAPAVRPDSALHHALSGGLAAVAQEAPWDYSAPVDDKPFFFHTVRRRDYLSLPWRAVTGDLMQIEEINAQAVWVVLRLLWISAAAAAVLVLGPLLLARRRLGRLPFGWPILYFACLGVGFVFVVSGNIGRLSVRFGNPTLAFVTLTFTTLLGASIGAALSPLLQGRPRGALLAVPLGVATFTAILGGSTFRNPILLGSLMALQGLLLGVPFPRGLDAIRKTAIVPWAFAANGALSVVAGSLSLVIALLFGYQALLGTGVAIYLAAALVFPLLPRDA